MGDALKVALERTNLEIARLAAHRNNLQKELLKEQNAELLKLDWFKGKKCIFFLELGDYANPTFKLRFCDYDAEKFLASFPSFTSLLGDSPNYWENLVVVKENVGYSLQSSNAKLFVDFLKTTKPEIEISPWHHALFQVLTAVNISEKDAKLEHQKE